MLKPFDCVDYRKLWKIPKEIGIPEHLTCLPRNLYASQEATIRTRHETMDLFQIGKIVWQGCILLLCFNQSVQLLSHVWLFATPWTAACQASLSITNSQSLLKLMSIESVRPSKHVILCIPSTSAFNISQHQSLLKWVRSSHQVAKVLEFQLQHQSFQWIFRIDFL